MKLSLKKTVASGDAVFCVGERLVGLVAVNSSDKQTERERDEEKRRKKKQKEGKLFRIFQVFAVVHVESLIYRQVAAVSDAVFWAQVYLRFNCNFCCKFQFDCTATSREMFCAEFNLWIGNNFDA